MFALTATRQVIGPLPAPSQASATAVSARKSMTEERAAASNVAARVTSSVTAPRDGAEAEATAPTLAAVGEAAGTDVAALHAAATTVAQAAAPAASIVVPAAPTAVIAEAATEAETPAGVAGDEATVEAHASQPAPSRPRAGTRPSPEAIPRDNAASRPDRRVRDLRIRTAGLHATTRLLPVTVVTNTAMVTTPKAEPKTN